MMNKRVALWRRISTDDYYIIYGDDGVDPFLYGTQSTENIQKLWDYINNYTFMELHPDKDVRVPRYTLRRLNMRIVRSSPDIFNTIKNKHVFVDLKKNN